MYAVIRTGGKQYKVAPGDVVRVESLDAKKGDTVEIKDVYMIDDGEKVSVGKPTLSATVTAEVVEEDRGEKLLIFKHRRRKTFRKTTGHRQNYTAIKVKEIKRSEERRVGKECRSRW